MSANKPTPDDAPLNLQPAHDQGFLSGSGDVQLTIVFEASRIVEVLQSLPSDLVDSITIREAPEMEFPKGLPDPNE